MLTKNTNRTTSLVAVTLLALLTLGTSAGVIAASRFSKNDVREIAHRHGYELGLRDGRSDSHRGGRFEVKDSRIYRDGMAGYRYEFGYERDYRNAFRDGFENGYRNGFNSFQHRGGAQNNGIWWNRRNTVFRPGRRF